MLHPLVYGHCFSKTIFRSLSYIYMPIVAHHFACHEFWRLLELFWTVYVPFGLQNSQFDPRYADRYHLKIVLVYFPTPAPCYSGHCLNPRLLYCSQMVKNDMVTMPFLEFPKALFSVLYFLQSIYLLLPQLFHILGYNNNNTLMMTNFNSISKPSWLGCESPSPWICSLINICLILP